MTRAKKKVSSSTWVPYTNQQRAAFQWIIGLLVRHRIAYQVSGGMAAKIYGSRRALIDIDIDIPDSAFAKLLPYIQRYVIHGPRYWTGEGFKVFLVTLDYHGQPIDLGGSEMTMIWHRAKKRWEQLPTDFTSYKRKKVLDRIIRVIPKAELVRYKAILDRRVDRKDLRDIAG